MARRVLADFDAELLLRLGNRTDITSTQRAQFIDDAYRLVALMFVHPELQGKGQETLADASFSLTPSTLTDIWWPEFVQDDSTGRPIDMKDKEEIEAHARSSGQVTEYYWWNNVFYFDRTQAGALTLNIWYKKTVTQLTTGQSPVFNQIYDPLVIMWAAKIGHETVGNQKMADVQEAQFKGYAQTMRLPVWEAKKNDRRKGFVVRYR